MEEPGYYLVIEPVDKVKLDINEDLEKRIIKYKPWFLILTGNKMQDKKIKFLDEKTGTEAEITEGGVISYNEKIILENEVDLIRTIAIICGVLKLAKIIYSDTKIQKLTFSILIQNVNNKEILRNEDLAIYGEIKINANSIEVKKEFLLNKNFYALDFVKQIILEICKKIDFPIDDFLLEKEIRDAIEILDNPLKLIKKI